MPESKPCLHLHLSRIANMDVGSFNSSPTQGVFRCQECYVNLIVRSIEPYEIKVILESKPAVSESRERFREELELAKTPEGD